MICQIRQILLLLLLFSVAKVNAFGEILSRPFRAETRVRVLCIDDAMVGCHDEDYDRSRSRSRNLQEQRFVSYQENIVSTGDTTQPPASVIIGGTDNSGISELPQWTLPPPPPSGREVFAGNFEQFWVKNGTITENGVYYDRYTVYVDTVLDSDKTDIATTQKNWLESGLVPDFAEYLEAPDGTPYVIRFYSTRNQNLMYSERIFDTIQALTEDDLALGSAQNILSQDNDGRERRSLIMSRTRAAAAANKPRSLQQTMLSGIVVPPSCYTDPSSRFCLAILATKTQDLTEIALHFAIGSAGGQPRTNLWARIQLGTANELLSVDGSATGCAVPVTYRIGGLAAPTSLEICLDGYIDHIPSLSLEKSMKLDAAVLFDFPNKTRNRIDLLGGDVRVNAQTLPGERDLRFSSLEADAFVVQRIELCNFGAALYLKTGPQDLREADDWLAYIYFAPFLGIDLFLWREAWRPRFKVAILGPEMLDAYIQPDIDFPASIDPATCPPQDFSKASDYHYVSFHLPGDAYVGNLITFQAGKYSVLSGTQCYDITWGILQFVCDRDGEWRQVGGDGLTLSTSDPTGGEPYNRCPSQGLDQDNLKYGILEQCKAIHLQVENRFRKVVIKYPAGQAIGSEVSLPMGRAAWPYQDQCYEIVWDPLVFKCNASGEWDLMQGAIRKNIFDLYDANYEPCEITDESSEYIQVIDKEPPTTPPPFIAPASAACSANSRCGGLAGNCCPTDSGVDLLCCGKIEGSCSANPACSHLKGDCCPTAKGEFLDCCNRGFASCSAHPQCSHLQGECCPTKSGKFLDCCMKDETASPIDWPQHPEIAQCSANGGCVGSDEPCCPTKDGTFMFCCGNYEPKCSAHPQCNKRGLTDDCCPTKEGVILACCERDYADARAHPACEGEGMMCPDKDGVIHECCLADPAMSKITFERITEDSASAACWVFGIMNVLIGCFLILWVQV